MLSRRAFPCLLVGAVVLIAGCADYVRSRLYRPEPMPAVKAWPGTPPDEVRATTADGLVLRGYLWPAARKDADLLVFFHGQSGNRYTAALMAAPLARDDLTVLVASFRGYGDNPGRPTEAGLAQDGAAFAALARRMAGPGRVYLAGYSLGAAAVLSAATRVQVDAVVTLGAFAELADMAPTLARGFLHERFDNRRMIARVTAPILIVHGTADEVVPFAQARRLREAAVPGNTRLIRIEGGGHEPDFEVLAPLLREQLAAMAPRRLAAEPPR